MQLKYCAITGADNGTDIKDLAAMEKDYPFVEWAILWMPERAGQDRFPTAHWIKSFKAACPDSHASLHLCGQALLDFVDGNKPDVMAGFKRIQLNLKFADAGEKIDLSQLVARVKENPDVQFILQYTEDRRDALLPLFKNVPNHALLFDASAGAGISPDKWGAPVDGHMCGYAGGLGPDNIEENLKMINQVAPKGYVTWVDMESKVRTDDKFDLAKVRRVLEIAKAYVVSAQKITPPASGL